MTECKHRAPHGDKISCGHPNVMTAGLLPASICDSCALAEPPKKMPGLFQRAWSFARAIGRWARHDRFRLAGKDETTKRRDICAKCEHNRNGWCLDCGCNIAAKTAIPDQFCLIGGWGEPKLKVIEKTACGTCNKGKIPDDVKTFYSGSDVEPPAVAANHSGESHPLPRNVTRFGVAITAAPRTPETLTDCVESVVASGFDRIHLFAEPETRFEGLPVLAYPNIERMGAWRNFIQALRGVLQVEPDAEAIVMLQDDTILCQDVRPFLEKDLWPSQNTGLVIISTPRIYGNANRFQRDSSGLVELKGNDKKYLAGAWGFVFPRAAAEGIVNHRMSSMLTPWKGWHSRTIPELARKKGIDTFVGHVLADLGKDVFAYVPSLGDHIGQSTIGHGAPNGKRAAAQFIGRDASAFTVQDKPPKIRYTLPAGAPRRDAVPVVAVVIPCHNYGRFLSEAIESVLKQEHPAAEILVVDDASTDNTRAVAMRYAAAGVRYLRINAGNVHDARHAGFNATSSPVLCFLDADDRLPRDYLNAAALLQRPLGIIYSNWSLFGTRIGVRIFPQFDAGRLMRENYIHAGSLVLREAIEDSRAFETPVPAETQNDWWLWRRIVNKGWTAEKQSAVYQYRRHGRSMQSQRRKSPVDYFDNAGLAHERLTLFVPPSGRHETVEPLLSFLERQTWPCRS